MMDPLSYADGFESDMGNRHNLNLTSILRSKTFQTVPPMNSSIMNGLIMIYPESTVINFPEKYILQWLTSFRII